MCISYLFFQNHELQDLNGQPTIHHESQQSSASHNPSNTLMSPEMTSYRNDWSASRASEDAHAYSPPAYPAVSPFISSSGTQDGNHDTFNGTTASGMQPPPAYDFVMANSDQFKVREEK